MAIVPGNVEDSNGISPAALIRRGRDRARVAKPEASTPSIKPRLELTQKPFKRTPDLMVGMVGYSCLDHVALVLLLFRKEAVLRATAHVPLDAGGSPVHVL
eukprot:scaffold78591_cov63-Phaeocystis_antarctica.AAC.2